MRLWMSGEVWHEIAEAFRFARFEIEAKVNEWLADRDYGSGLVELAFIPMVTPPGIGYPNERKLFRRRERQLECRLKLDYPDFASGSPSRQRQLVVAGILRCLEIARSKRIPEFETDRLITEFRRFATEQGWSDPAPKGSRVT